jgi:hypothetical protein
LINPDINWDRAIGGNDRVVSEFRYIMSNQFHCNFMSFRTHRLFLAVLGALDLQLYPAIDLFSTKDFGVELELKSLFL